MRFVMPLAAALLAVVPAMAQDFVKPGAELKVGESAVVPFISGTDMAKPVPVRITFTEVEKGSADDLKGFDIPAEMKDYVPYYVRYKWTNLSDADLSFKSIAGIYILDDRNQQQSWSRTEGQRFEKCRAGGTVKDMKKDVSAEGCNIFMIHKDGALGAVLYKGNNPDAHAEVKAIYADPVRWVPAEKAPSADAAPDAAKGRIVN